VLFSGTSLGYLNGFGDTPNIPPTEFFYMGGTGLGYIGTTPLRGYDERSVGPKNSLGQEIGGNVMVKHTFEIRYALTLNPIPIYLLTFAEGGNVFSDFKHTDFFDLKRSFGFGARLLVNPIGLFGFDYGYGADHVLGPGNQPDGWRFHFQFGRGF
jgi:outer membrane protein insertion porin family